MYPTLIERELGFLGPYERILEPGKTQQLVFCETDTGPFWMTPNGCNLNCHDQQVDGNPSIVQRNKSEFILELHGKGISTKGKRKRARHCYLQPQQHPDQS